MIMPFSATDSCTQQRWTWIFETLLKPAVENAGLNYVCRRSTAKRGNIIAAIMESLREAYVVLADLTDQNPNVFYELGVRHAMKNRTILIAQNEKFIPFDLRPYAYHIYDWKTAKGKRKLASKLRELLADADQFPDRADNPVSDFLKGRAATQASAQALTITPQEGAVAQALAGPASKEIDALALGRSIASAEDKPRLRALIRQTRAFCAEEWARRIEALNRQAVEEARLPERIPENEIYQRCIPYVAEFAADAVPVEAFGLALVEAEYRDGLVEMLRVVEDWISMSDKVWPSPSLKPITGAPGLLALRVLATWGAKAAEDMSLNVLGTLLTNPLETVEATGQAATLCLVDRRDMFHPGGLLDRADLAVRYLQDEPWKNSEVAKMFASRQDYLNGLSRLLFLAALLREARHPDDSWPLYPGFKLVDGSSRSLHAFVGRISTSPQLMDSLAKMANEDVATFRSNWPKRARRLNQAELGDRYFTLFHDFPEEI
ncbi:MAG: hypothetical protein Q8P22_11875 [Chloroflexota bacterium]|nr:hypothetical protein [Chloroflexota bacterium]